MIQTTHGLRFAQEALFGLRILAESHQFDRDLAANVRIYRQKDVAHPTAAQQALDPVLPDVCRECLDVHGVGRPSLMTTV